MSLREKLGGMLEEELNELVDALDVDALLDKLAEKLKAEARKVLDVEIKEKLKANYIDKIDGVDDIKDV